MSRNQPTEMWTVETGEYSDHRVLCVCPTKKQAETIAAALNSNNKRWGDAFIGTLPVATDVNYWHPLAAAIETALTRTQTGCNQPVTPAPWMSQAAEHIANAILRYTSVDNARNIARTIELEANDA